MRLELQDPVDYYNIYSTQNAAYDVVWSERDNRQESRAVARTPHDAAAVVFGLK